MIHLINPSEKGILDGAGDRIPIGILSIASQLKRDGVESKVWDLNHQTENDLIDYLKKDSNAVSCISVYTSPLYIESVRLAEKIRPYSKKLIAGGYHATAMPNSLFPFFDVIITGDGENAISTAIDTSEKLVNGGSVDLNELANIDYSFINLEDYGLSQNGKRTATLITSRGCPMSCAFCGKMERKVRYHPTEHIKEQIDTLKNAGFDSLYFLDDVFTLNKDRMKEIVEYAKEKEMPFRATTRVNLLDKSRLEILAKNGCEIMSLGLESGNNEILRKCNKYSTIEKGRKVVSNANDLGIKTKGFFIIGLPGETEETAQDTLNFAIELKKIGMESADFYYLTPFPGTPIWNSPKNFEVEIITRDFTKYLIAGPDAQCFVNTKELKAKRIEELVREARIEYEMSGA